MKYFNCSLLLSAAVSVIAAWSTATAQPHGWPCDYGLRPGNTWFYASTSFKNGYSETVVRDSMAADGHYWVNVASPSFGENDWYRIDSNCTIDFYHAPTDRQFKQWFVASADSGDWWVVDTVTLDVPTYAQINAIYHPGIFGRTVRSKEVVYYSGGAVGKDWFFSEEWAEGIGVIRRRSHPNGYDELVGAIIDGVAYGNTSGITEPLVTGEGLRIAIHPLPASDHTTLEILARAGGHARIELHDMLGRLLRHQEVNELTDGANAVPIDLSGLAAGRYLIAVDLNGVRATASLVVVR
ncbi:MAG: T9SS type A sorting domain-containing protein [Bacteroidetes bacterium]|nr:T9SS type A sorting domain-containing protein [Bacteroidota bacterium]